MTPNRPVIWGCLKQCPVSRQFWWPALRQDVKQFVSVCDVCARNKSQRNLPVGLLQPLPIPDRPWSHISMDFIVDLPASKGNTVILTIVDLFSRMAHFVPLPKLPSALDLVPVFINNVVKLHGIPVEIVSDRGTQFVSQFWRGFCNSMGVKLAFSSAYHPQTNVASKRANQGLEQYLRCFISQQQNSWYDYLSWAEYARNNCDNETTGHSPFFTIYGFHPPTLPSHFPTSNFPALEKHLHTLQQTWVQIKELSERNVVTQKGKADKKRRMSPVYQVGDQVWLSTCHIRLQVPTMILAPHFIGPYRVLRRINPVSYRLALPPAFHIRNVFHVSVLKPLLCNRFTRVAVPPPPIEVEGE
uniref:Gypsy retrotransposon integrase-like protein 1 n=1 Tax=Leptobrachium leishanense TaxID=445787 RepID=A0A8C5N3N2_9ANUR